MKDERLYLGVQTLLSPCFAVSRVVVSFLVKKQMPGSQASCPIFLRKASMMSHPTRGEDTRDWEIWISHQDVKGTFLVALLKQVLLNLAEPQHW